MSLPDVWTGSLHTLLDQPLGAPVSRFAFDDTPAPID